MFFGGSSISNSTNAPYFSFVREKLTLIGFTLALLIIHWFMSSASFSDPSAVQNALTLRISPPFSTNFVY